MLQTATVFCLDPDGRVLSSREIQFATRAELIHQLEPELAGCATAEAWQDDVCVLRMKTHGQIEWQDGENG